jgi:hypothetical protein
MFITADPKTRQPGIIQHRRLTKAHDCLLNENANQNASLRVATPHG